MVELEWNEHKQQVKYTNLFLKIDRVVRSYLSEQTWESIFEHYLSDTDFHTAVSFVEITFESSLQNSDR